MLTCFVIDDEAHAIKSLTAYIERTPLLQLIGSSGDPVSCLSHFQHSNHYPDMIFLDIEMPKLSGIEAGKLLKDKTEIVFTTAYPNFAVYAFEMEISDYLLKPFSFERFLKCVQKVSDRLGEKNKKQLGDDFFYIQAEAKGKLIKILFDAIHYIQGQKNYVAIVTKDKKHLTYLTLAEIEQQLPSKFLRISKSFIINTDYISHVAGDEIFLLEDKNGYTIGSSYRESFNRFIKDYLIKTRRLNP